MTFAARRSIALAELYCTRIQTYEKGLSLRNFKVLANSHRSRAKWLVKGFWLIKNARGPAQ
jgi:hypothetical protein